MTFAPDDRPLPTPDVQWAGGVLRSRRFQDFYFDPRDGVAQSRHAFLAGNRLAERFAAARHFVVAETGFGTGLNFLLCRNLWRSVAQVDAQLHYVGVEGFPLARWQLERALSPFAVLARERAELLARWPPSEPGFRRLVFDGGRLRLTLLLGEVSAMLESLDAQVDAWFLDGFAPSRNPEMWCQPVLERVSALSNAGATFGTYTVAGEVRRGLAQAGFQVEKRRGIGAKREMLIGRLVEQGQQPEASPWFARPCPVDEGRIAVIGAGVAGCAAARALAGRGRSVLLFDRQPEPATQASGNPAGVVMPLIAAARGAPQRWYTAAFRFAIDQFRRLSGRSEWTPCGVLQCALTERERARFRRIMERAIWPDETVSLAAPDEASAIAGVELPWNALFFPEAGWVHPPGLCRDLIDSADVETRFDSDIRRVVWTEGQWRILDGSGRELGRAQCVVVTAGVSLSDLLPVAEMPLQPMKGQITLIPESEVSANVRTVIGGAGYVLPARRGQHLIGATFEPEVLSAEPSPAANERNIATATRLCPALESTFRGRVLNARVAVRAATLDAMPVCGPVPEWPAFRRAFDGLDLGRRPGSYPSAPYQPGLFVCGGYGSRGLVSAPLAAELIAALICGEPLPVERRVAEAIHPARFLVRALARRDESQQ